MLKLKLQYCGHLMQRAKSLEETLMYLRNVIKEKNKQKTKTQTSLKKPHRQTKIYKIICSDLPNLLPHWPQDKAQTS